MKYNSKRQDKRKDKGWIVKNDRPEEYLVNPAFYYTDEEVESYARSGGMRRAQERLAARVLDFLDLKKSSKILDIGAGPGYTAGVYRANGHEVTCIDLIPKMVEKAKEKGFKSVQGDMRDLKKLFPKSKYNAVVSVSALQWIKGKEDLKRVAEGIYYVLSSGGRIVIQFYPKSKEEAKSICKIFNESGFNGDLVIENEDIPKNRTVFLVMKKE